MPVLNAIPTVNWVVIGLVALTACKPKVVQPKNEVFEVAGCEVLYYEGPEILPSDLAGLEVWLDSAILFEPIDYQGDPIGSYSLLIAVGLRNTTTEKRSLYVSEFKPKASSRVFHNHKTDIINIPSPKLVHHVDLDSFPEYSRTWKPTNRLPTLHWPKLKNLSPDDSAQILWEVTVGCLKSDQPRALQIVQSQDWRDTTQLGWDGPDVLRSYMACPPFQCIDRWHKSEADLLEALREFLVLEIAEPDSTFNAIPRAPHFQVSIWDSARTAQMMPIELVFWWGWEFE